MHRAAAAVTTGLLALILLAAPAYAHGELASSDPPDEGVVPAPVHDITFVFTGPVEPFVDGYTITTISGAEIPVARVVVVDDATVRVVPGEPLVEPFVAQWAVVSGDSHPVTGVISVVVDIPTPPEPVQTPNPSAVTQPPPMDPEASLEALDELATEAAERSLIARVAPGAIRSGVYLATLVVLGALALTSWRRRRNRADASLQRAAVPLVRVGSVVLAVGAYLSIGAQMVDLSGNIDALVDIGQWGDVFTGRLRVGVLIRIAGACALLMTTFVRWPLPWSGVGAGLVLISYPVLGHGAGDTPAWLSGPATVVHVAAVSVWIGGLVALAVTSRRPDVHLRDHIGTFSRAAGIALGAAFIAGTALAVAELGSASALWSSGYGQRLLIKLAVVLGVVACGAIHRFRTVPEVLGSSGRRGVGSFQTLAGVEIALAIAVLATTAWLVAAG